MMKSDNDDDEDPNEGEIDEEKEQAMALLNKEKPSLHYRWDHSICSCFFCSGKKINKWNISQLLI